jgi:hypothetical protein
MGTFHHKVTGVIRAVEMFKRQKKLKMTPEAYYIGYSSGPI